MRNIFYVIVMLCITISNLFAIDVEENFYVSLRSNEVNLRMGPGNEYPVKSVYQVINMPLYVVWEYDNWYKTRDKYGDEGWVNKNLVSKKKYLIVNNGTQLMYERKNIKSDPIFRVEENVVVKYVKCDEEWCKVEIENETGWMLKNSVWGID